MARDRSGLRKRGNIWHLEKRVKGYGRISESTGTADRAEAERYAAHRLEQIRRVTVYGERPSLTFAQAAAKFVEENTHLRSLERSAQSLDAVMPYIGGLQLEQVHDGTMAAFVKDRTTAGISAGTINRDIAAVRRVLQLAARKWRHPNGMTYLPSAPLLSLAHGDKRKPYPLSWEEQQRLLQELPGHLQQMALFDLNTGLRDQELCQLRWHWEVQVPELSSSVFVLPESLTKNGRERVVVLNRTARAVLEARRGQSSDYVFTYEGRPLSRMNNTSWKKARARAGLPQLRVHDLRHTFGHRLRAAGVSIEDRKDLLGHTTGDITTHYSAPDIAHLLECANRICDQRPSTVLRICRQDAGNADGKVRGLGEVAVSA